MSPFSCSWIPLDKGCSRSLVMRSGRHFVKFFGVAAATVAQVFFLARKKKWAEVLKFCFLRGAWASILLSLFALCFGGLDVRKKKVEPKGLSRTFRPSATSWDYITQWEKILKKVLKLLDFMKNSNSCKIRILKFFVKKIRQIEGRFALLS